MRALLDVLKFEIHYQLRSPFFLGALLIFALIHFLSITGIGIHLDISNLVAINSGFAILHVELLLFIFGMLPMVAFIAAAITRDFEYGTAPVVFVTPVSARSFVLGRFLGALSLALLISLAGLLGSMIGTLMPWLDPARILPFTLLPWVYTFLVVILPSTAILCAIFFSVAALTRSVALTWATAMAFFVADVLLNLYAEFNNAASAALAAMADPSARLAVAAETRYWTAADLNANLPVGLLPHNRLLWLMLALLALLVTLWRFRLDLDLTDRTPFRFKLRRQGTATTLEPAHHSVALGDPRIPAQFVAQLKMDLSGIFKSPLVYIILALVIVTTIAEHQNNVSPFGLGNPLYPLTSVMLPFLRFGLLQFVLLIGIYYPAELIYRERASGISGIVNASPFPDWLMLLSKTTALCLLVHALLLTAVGTLMALQTAAGYTHFEPGLYLQSAFLYNGIYYCMLCVLAVVIQAITPNKWLGMLLTLSVFIAFLSLGALGFDHVLYNFGIPYAVYSDMNGFGHFAKPVFWLIAYWGAFCILLMTAGFLLYPRGNYSAVRERLRDARNRLGPGVRHLAGCAAVAFAGIGGWIFYNTNVLNQYVTPDERLHLQAEYEKAYGRYDNAPTPSYDSIHMAVDIFPEERRMESRGTATLGNHKQKPIGEFVVSLDPRLHVNQMTVDNATLAQSDKAQGFYLYRLNVALEPGATVKMAWNVTRKNEGFVASDPDNELVTNGTFVNMVGADVIPIPGYDGFRRITDNALRRKYGLAPAPRRPALGDPDYQDRVAYGIDSRTGFEIVISTSADQIAVAPGALLKEWHQAGRRYFHYKAEEPILPNLSISSARYAVARDRWNGVALEIYYDPKHPFSIPAMMATAKRALEFYSAEFAPYQYSYLRVLEYPRYSMAAKFMPGVIPYSEAIGFVTDLRTVENADYAIMHELGHMWWGDRIIGAQVQGRQMLSETMTEYATQMLFQQYYAPVYSNRLSRAKLDHYLKSRRSEDEAELPVMYTEDQGYLRAKGPLNLYALQDIIGKDKVHRALRKFLKDFSFQTSPCPTARDLVNALRAEAGPEYQALITDLFERIVLYDLQVVTASARPLDGGYEVTIEVRARQFEANGRGEETEVPLDSWFDVALFPETSLAIDEVTPLTIGKHRLHSGKQSLTVRTAKKPGIAALDPFHKRIDRSPGNNSRKVDPR